MNDTIKLFQTPVSDCPYLDDRDSANYIVDPAFAMSPAVYDLLLDKGFRRSASLVYRPACPSCQACRSTRLPVKLFKPNRAQRRAWSKVAAELHWHEKPASFDEAHYELYLRYTRHRHASSEMSQSGEAEYLHFLTSPWSDTRFVEIWLDQTLLAVAVTDFQPNSLSALYTFFDISQATVSPGVLAILVQLEIARNSQRDWLYLGYWIEECRKMAYKAQYRPLQYLERDRWHLLER